MADGAKAMLCDSLSGWFDEVTDEISEEEALAAIKSLANSEDM